MQQTISTAEVDPGHFEEMHLPLLCLPNGDLVTRRWIPVHLPRTSDGRGARPGRLLQRVECVVVGDTGRRDYNAQTLAGNRDWALGHFIVDDKAIIERVPTLTSCAGRVEQASPPRRSAEQGRAIFVSLCFGSGVNATLAQERCERLEAYLCRHFSATNLVGPGDPTQINASLANGFSIKQLSRAFRALLKPASVAGAAKDRARPPEKDTSI